MKDNINSCTKSFLKKGIGMRQIIYNKIKCYFSTCILNFLSYFPLMSKKKKKEKKEVKHQFKNLGFGLIAEHAYG